VLIGRDKIEAALATVLAGEQAALAVEAELTLGDRLGRAGLLVVTRARLLFVTEPISAAPEVRVFALSDTEYSFDEGFMGLELRLEAAGEPLASVRRLAHVDLEAVYQALCGAPLVAQASVRGQWQARLSGTGLSAAAQGERIAIEGTGADEGLAGPQRRRESKAGNQVRQADPRELRGRLAKARARHGAAAAREVESPPVSTAVSAKPASGGTLARVGWTSLAMAASYAAGTALGEELTADLGTLSTQRELEDAVASYGAFSDVMNGLYGVFVPYLLVATLIMLAMAKGRRLWSFRLYRVNVVGLCGAIFLSGIASGGGDHAAAALAPYKTGAESSPAASPPADAEGQPVPSPPAAN